MGSMAFRKAAQSAGRRLARQARSLSVAPRSLLITENLAAEASASRALPTQLSFSKSFAAAAEPAAAPAASESTGYVSQVMSRPRSRPGVQVVIWLTTVFILQGSKALATVERQCRGAHHTQHEQCAAVAAVRPACLILSSSSALFFLRPPLPFCTSLPIP